MDKYTYKDIIIDPADPRVEIGEEYYFTATAKVAIDIANSDELGTLVLGGINKNCAYPFRANDGGGDYVGSYACLIRKKKSEKRYTPFDLSKSEVKCLLRNEWITDRESGEEQMIVSFNKDNEGLWYANNISACSLLDNYVFWDGTPCGEEVED